MNAIEERDNLGRFKAGRVSAKRNGKFVACEHCGKETYKSKCHLHHSRHFCSIQCWNDTQFAESTRKEPRICVICGGNFMSEGHTNTTTRKVYWDKTCGPDCRRRLQQSKWAYKKCKYCGKRFRYYMRHIARKSFCSKDCQNAFKTASQTFTIKCQACGKELKRQNSRPSGPFGMFCSTVCSDAYLKRENAINWKGGWFQNSREMVMINVGMSTVVYAAHPYGHPVYRARYRVMVELQRHGYLKRHWPVMHLNGDSLDDRIDNLYVCSSPTQHAKMRQGTLPWPTKTNVDEIIMDGRIDYDRHPDDVISKYITESLERNQ